MPPRHVDQQRPLGELLVLRQVLQRIAGKQQLLAVAKQVLQRQVDRPHGAVEIDGAEQLALVCMNRISAFEPAVMDRQPALR